VFSAKADIAKLGTDIAKLICTVQKMHQELYDADAQILAVLANVDQRLTSLFFFLKPQDSDFYMNPLVASRLSP
jgi:hypothetical protein